MDHQLSQPVPANLLAEVTPTLAAQILAQRPRRTQVNNCVVCGTVFTRNSKLARYCSRSCEGKAYRARSSKPR